MNKLECFESESELSQYLDNEISGARRYDLDIHLEVCNKCLKQLIAWKKLKSLVRGVSQNQKAPLHLMEKINMGILGVGDNNEFFIWDKANGEIDGQSAQLN
jgi:anti-sigma factor (TIGR02949 family)